jgi:hypothetical protein
MMTFTEFPLMIFYSQLSVFDRSLDRPFNDWTDRHVAQGFSWRPGSVAFGTIEEGGRHIVTVGVGWGSEEPAVDAIRVIDVPFEVPKAGVIEVASISGGVPLRLPAGTYQLRFECFDQGNSSTPRIRLSFWREGKPQFKLVRADSELSPRGDLLLTASPA